MVFWRKVGSLLLMTALVFPLLYGRALAHRFNVALVIPLSNAASAQGRQIRDGFMLATKERDSHRVRSLMAISGVSMSMLP